MFDIPAIFYKFKNPMRQKKGVFKSMRILAFNWRDTKNPLAGGAEEYLFNILSLIANEKNKITYFTASFPGSNPIENGENYTIIRKGSRFTVYFHAALFYIKNRKKYDIVIDSINTVPFFTPLYVGKKKRIAIIHHIGEWETIRKELPVIPAIVAYMASKLALFLYKNTRIITVSNSTKDELISKDINEKHISIVWNGLKMVNNHYSKRVKKAGVPTVVYIGRVKLSKNLDHLIHAFKIVKAKIKEAELVIGGKGDEECYHYLKGIAEKENISNVHLLGMLSEEDKRKYMESGWVFVYPSTKEGWGLSVIEANACGTPAVGYDVSGLKESIQNGKTGFLAKKNNINELADRIIIILENRELREELEKNAMKWAGNFSYEKSAEEFYKIFKSI